jgi:putative ABC transport system substrate-binding protein
MCRAATAIPISDECATSPFRVIRGYQVKDMKTWLSGLLIAVLLALTAGFAQAQQAAKVPQIGYLNTHMRPFASSLREPFLEGLRELGYVEGQNIIINSRIGEEGQFRELAAELVRLKMDVIVAQPPAIRAAMSATRTIPIVTIFRGDPVLNGFVASLERPGSNVTGIGGLTMELGGKWLELIKETIPSSKQVAVFWNRRAEERFPLWRSVDSTARALGVEVLWEEVPFQLGSVGPGNTSAGSLYRRLRTAALRQPDAFIVLPGLDGRNMEDIAEFGLRNRIPGIFWSTDLDMEMGGLMSYGVNRFEQSRRAAYFVDKILKGAKPAELPVELPKKFELVVNLKTAKEIGVKIPDKMLTWADRIIK